MNIFIATRRRSCELPRPILKRLEFMAFADGIDPGIRKLTL